MMIGLIVIQLVLAALALGLLPRAHMVKADWLLVPVALIPIVGFLVVAFRSLIVLLKTYGDTINELFNAPFVKLNPWEAFHKDYKYLQELSWGWVITTHPCKDENDYHEKNSQVICFSSRHLQHGHYDLTYLTREEYEKSIKRA